jgi:hypothetical protein
MWDKKRDGNKIKPIKSLSLNGPKTSGGEGGIRTPDTGFASVTA